MPYEQSKVSDSGNSGIGITPIVGFEYCHQFSRVAGETPEPGSLGEGELAINIADRVIYFRGESGLAAIRASLPQVVSSGGLADLTESQASSIEQGSIVTTTDGRRWVYSGSGGKYSQASYVELSDITPTWDSIAGKPTSFPPGPPTVVSLTYAATLNTDASAGDIFDVTLTGSVTIANPTNPVDGKTLRWRLRQDGSGNRSISLGNKFTIPSTASNPLPFSTSANAMDILAATYHAGRDKWDIVAMVPGY